MELSEPLPLGGVHDISPKSFSSTSKVESDDKRARRILSAEGRMHASLARKVAACAVCGEEKVKVCFYKISTS